MELSYISLWDKIAFLNCILFGVLMSWTYFAPERFIKQTLIIFISSNNIINDPKRKNKR